ncbi:hypothetical protein GCM10023169_01100 [Georgenia halophila]|uniref:Uncharacterized protein n=1 Tax=Georgenia halophila TaxID=620889 RepID=A0ABP8KT13_9MICO
MNEAQGPPQGSDLAAAGATWDADASAGEWIAPLLGPPGATLDHAVPRGYERYAVVPVPETGEPDGPEPLAWLDALLNVLEPFTGEQAVHCGIWTGWGWMYDHGDDPVTARGMAVLVARRGWRGRVSRWASAVVGRFPAVPDAMARSRPGAEAEEHLRTVRVERPDAPMLALPHPEYHLWTGPLRSATAFRQWPHDPPSLIWPDDRSWFVGIPIYTLEAAVGGSTALVDAVVGDPRLGARRAQPGTVLKMND